MERVAEYAPSVVVQIAHPKGIAIVGIRVSAEGDRIWTTPGVIVSPFEADVMRGPIEVAVLEALDRLEIIGG